MNGSDPRLRVVVTGATGNVGTSVLEALGAEPAVKEIAGLARRLPEMRMPEVEWVQADVVEDDLVPIFEGADADGGLTPPLDPAAGGPLRAHEVTTGVGGRQ